MKFINKKELVLRLLYESKKGGNMHSIYDLLKNEDVEIDFNEANDIADALSYAGLIQYSIADDVALASINFNGIEYVEDNMVIEDYFTSLERKEFSARLEEFKKKLVSFGLGKKTIYDNLSEDLDHLKSLLAQLPKKDWANAFRGTLICHGLGVYASQIEALLLEIFRDTIPRPLGRMWH